VSGNTEIRRLTKETQKRREQTEILNRRVHQLKEDAKKKAAENPEATQKPPTEENP
jgi:hypothetical protein